MNDKQTFSFPLQRNGETLGMIHWQDGNAEISGDAAAVAAFEEAIQGGDCNQVYGQLSSTRVSHY